jgi:hypothetical protein
MLFTMPSSVAEVEQEINTLLVVVLVDLGLIIQAAGPEVQAQVLKLLIQRRLELMR